MLLGEPTLRVVRETVEVEPIEPLRLKGKSEPVPAFRLVVVREAPDRRHDAPFVGREREREELLEAWRRAVAEQRCQLVTVVGDAGVGKSRLVAELIASLDAPTVHGRCLPYGEGVGYWPVVEVLKQLDLLPEQENAAAAIRSVLGEFDAPTSANELAWAFRKTLERAAATEPLAVVFDDLQWGDEPFLDLVEHVALFSNGVPLLLLCIARPELLELRPGWPVTLRLDPLGEDAVEHAQRLGLPVSVAGWSSTGRTMGTTSVQDTLVWLKGLDEVDLRNHFVRGNYAIALAMSGRIDEAWATLTSLREELLDRGDTFRLALTEASSSSRVSELAGELERAAAFLEEGCRMLGEEGERSILATCAGYLARILSRLDRLDEALGWAERGLAVGAPDDVLTQMVCRQAKALVAAREGQADEAVQLAREAVEISLETDLLDDRGNACFDLGEVLALTGYLAGAAEAYERALACYERKGNLVSAAQTRERLEAVQPAS